MFKKKFKVRVKRYYNEYPYDTFVVQYSNSYFIPFWRTIKIALELLGQYNYIENVFSSYNNAIDYAKTIKSYDDIIIIEKLNQEIYKEWKVKQKESRKNKPKDITNIL